MRNIVNTLILLYRIISSRYQKLFLEYRVSFKPRYGHGLPPHKDLYALIDSHREAYAELLHEVLNHAGVFHQLEYSGAGSDAAQPVYNNGYLPAFDMMGIYTMIARYRPAKYVEIGSGNSTKMARMAIRNHALHTRVISIDPEPRAEIQGLVDEFYRKPLEAINLEIFTKLGENDIVFVDNSHRILPNSDAMVFFMEVLPKLAEGVIVHFHDVYLPYDYPQFMCDRFYSEQYGLALSLMANPGRYVPLLPNYFISEDPELSTVLGQLWDHPNLNGLEKHGGSFWLRISHPLS
jgi:hypothetical protein